MCQAVFANIFVQGRVVHSYMYGFFDDPIILCPSLPMVLKFSIVVMWQVFVVFKNQ